MNYFFLFPQPCESYWHKFRRRGADLGYCIPVALLEPPHWPHRHPSRQQHTQHCAPHISPLPSAPILQPGTAGRGVPSQPFRVTSAKGLSQRLHCRPMTPGLQGHCPVSMSQVRVWEPEGKQSQG